MKQLCEKLEANIMRTDCIRSTNGKKDGSEDITVDNTVNHILVGEASERPKAGHFYGFGQAPKGHGGRGSGCSTRKCRTIPLISSSTFAHI